MSLTVGKCDVGCCPKHSEFGPEIGATNAGSASRGVWAIAVCSVVLLIAFQAAQAQTEKVLYSFCPQAGCADGALPDAGLVMDKHSNLYGTTQLGGNDSCSNGCGTVFELSASLTESVLHSFGSTGTDGLDPLEGVVMDRTGNLYGTTPGGGALNGSPGTLYKVSPKGVETILYDFCSLKGCNDGFYPESPLIMDKAGDLYGTTAQGGDYGGGTVFEFSASGVFMTIYNFCSQTGCSDGDSPRGVLAIDKKGNLYGTTWSGGANNYGTVFELSANGGETVLHSFANNGMDGYYPTGGVVLGKKGNLYGTTYYGGTTGGGIIFEVSTAGSYSKLHTFAGAPDGFAPYASLVMNKAGDFFGTTVDGGTNGYGTVFEFSAGTVTVLHSFNNDGVDGVYPYAPVVLDKAGNLYGTTQLGGTNNKGTVFQVTP